MRALICTLLVMFCSSFVGAQTTGDRAAVLSEISRTLSEIGFTDYVDHLAEGYIVSRHENDWAGENVTLGLENLISMSLQSPRQNWRKIILGYFQNMKNIRGETAQGAPKLAAFDSALDYLRLRIYPLDYLPNFEKTAVYRRNPLGFLEVVVVNYPSSVGNLDRTYLEKWEKTVDEVVALATAATVDENHESFRMYQFKYNSTIYLMTSDTNLFLTTDILDATLKGAPVGSLGAFVSVPNRINMPVLVLDDKATLNALTVEFMLLTQYLYKLGPGSITSEFYWFDGKRLYPVAHDPQNGAIRLPDELVARLK